VRSGVGGARPFISPRGEARLMALSICSAVRKSLSAPSWGPRSSLSSSAAPGGAGRKLATSNLDTPGCWFRFRVGSADQ